MEYKYFFKLHIRILHQRLLLLSDIILKCYELTFIKEKGRVNRGSGLPQKVALMHHRSGFIYLKQAEYDLVMNGCVFLRVSGQFH